MRTLWIVSGGAEAVPGIRHAKSMGLHVVVSDGNQVKVGAMLDVVQNFADRRQPIAPLAVNV